MVSAWHYASELIQVCQDVQLSRDPWGSIELELYRDPRWIVSISIDQESCYWAALLGDWDPRGSCLISEGIPAKLLDVINAFHTQKE